MTIKEKLDLFFCESGKPDAQIVKDLEEAGMIYLDDVGDDLEAEEFGKHVYRPTAAGGALAST